MPPVNTIGLLFASASSVANVVTDVARKKALRNIPLLQAIFLVQICIVPTLTAVLATRLVLGHPFTIHTAATESVFILAQHLPPHWLFFFYLCLDTGLVGIATILYFRALQISPISLCVPFLAFTPVFLLVTGLLFLGERVSCKDMAGVGFVVLGSLLMNRRPLQRGWLEPLRALIREKGSRYMLVVGCIFSITNPIDKRLVEMSDPFFHAWAYAVMLVLLLGLSLLIKRRPLALVTRPSWGWIVLAALLEATALLLQFVSHKYIQVVITISLKRAGVILTVIFGGLIFREHHMVERLIAASVMTAGALMLYLPLTGKEALIYSVAVPVFLAVALLLIPSRGMEAATESI
jgi:drug/metabolite transporter (DMT)-like permease